MKALAIIREEHQSIAAVLHGMLFMLKQILERRAQPDFKVLGAMIYYLDAFPERFHHPKEDAFLFRILRLRYPLAAPLLDRLHEQHETGARKIAALEQALMRFQHGGRGEFPAFSETLKDYANFHWDHMRTEETEALPLAEKHLLPEDWKAIDEAFTAHTDPLLGDESRKDYAALFRRIVNLAPPPIGVGPDPDGPKGRRSTAGSLEANP